MTLFDVNELIKSFDLAEHHYIGKLDGMQEKAIGVYSRSQSGSPLRAFGEYSSYGLKPVTVMVHWDKNAHRTELAALELFEALKNTKNTNANGTLVHFIKLLGFEPFDIGTDKNGVYERVINFDVYYERNE